MAITLQALVDTACLLAGPAGLKRGPDAELLVPRILTWVAQRAAADPLRRALVMDAHTLTLVNGSAALPATVLVQYMDFAAVADPTDPDMARKMRWISDWREFIRPLNSDLGYFTVTENGTIFHMTRPGAVYTPGDGMDGDVILTAPSRPAIVGGTIVTAGEIEQEVIAALVAALKGNWEVAAVTENSK